MLVFAPTSAAKDVNFLRSAFGSDATFFIIISCLSENNTIISNEAAKNLLTPDREMANKIDHEECSRTDLTRVL